MRLKTVLTITVLITLFAGSRLYRSYVERQALEAGREAGKNAATAAVYTQVLRGEWIGENQTVTLSADNTYRESYATRIEGKNESISYSYRFSYVLSGRWRFDEKELIQEVTDVSHVTITEIDASSDRLSEQERNAFVQIFRKKLPGETLQKLKKEMVGRTFVSEVALPEEGTLILKSSPTDTRRYSRVR